MNTLSGKRPLAFFDIDGVLVEPYVIEYFHKYLAAQDPPLFSLEAEMAMAEQLATYVADGDYRKFSLMRVPTYSKGLRGQSVAVIQEYAEQFWQENWTQFVYNYSAELVKVMAEACDVVAVSGSPVEALAPLCKRLGIAHLEASESAHQHGVYTGECKQNRGVADAKQAVVSQYIDKLKNPSLLEQSFGFGDTDHDRPLLEHVGSPYLISDFATPEEQERATQFLNALKSIPSLLWLHRPTDNEYLPQILRMRIWSVRSSNR